MALTIGCLLDESTRVSDSPTKTLMKKAQYNRCNTVSIAHTIPFLVL